MSEEGKWHQSAPLCYPDGASRLALALPWPECRLQHQSCLIATTTAIWPPYTGYF